MRRSNQNKNAFETLFSTQQSITYSTSVDMPSNDVSTPTGSFNSPVMQTKPLERFEKFPELPEKLRLKVWEFACNWQRVVGVLETHEPNGFGDQGLEIATILGSTTRCPAVLGVCKESRTKALSIYTPIDEGIRTKGARYDIPIYMNLEVDILHRGKIPCSTGKAGFLLILS